ncbi:hypothetical protein [Halomonas sp. OfavH-34-E]|uniref:hypothetical protein n=1 Tax=Halomonas sp. OfavH-34-E TaxID=2954491 RepID=UPI002096F372|nr:hypothetical protein [Halomonas sp. OfavH-34-E]MCO7215093.1 hypothetical protein [Halomonas sp. OfavH-34-E]
METTTSESGDQRAVLTLSIEGARFSDMGMERVGEIFGLLAQIAGEESVLVRYSGGEIIVKEGRPGGAAELIREDVEEESDA